jgi:hypothetical protein
MMMLDGSASCEVGDLFNDVEHIASLVGRAILTLRDPPNRRAPEAVTDQ